MQTFGDIEVNLWLLGRQYPIGWMECPEICNGFLRATIHELIYLQWGSNVYFRVHVVQFAHIHVYVKYLGNDGRMRVT